MKPWNWYLMWPALGYINTASAIHQLREGHDAVAALCIIAVVTSLMAANRAASENRSRTTTDHD